MRKREEERRRGGGGGGEVEKVTRGKESEGNVGYRLLFMYTVMQTLNQSQYTPLRGLFFE